MTTPETQRDWHDEPWARQMTALNPAERDRLSSAACTILAHRGHIPDPLESELTILLESLGDDPGHEPEPSRLTIAAYLLTAAVVIVCIPVTALTPLWGHEGMTGWVITEVLAAAMAVIGGAEIIRAGMLVRGYLRARRTPQD